MEIIDSHTHWSPSLTMGTEVTTEEILQQADQSGVQKIVIFPFPSTAIADERINGKLLEDAKRTGRVLLLDPLQDFLPTLRFQETPGDVFQEL
jgi:hypothetical protein